MLIHELSAEECKTLLARVGLARLGCSHNDQPYVVPVHVHLDGDDLFGFSTLGQKIEWMRANPKVCLEADEIEDASHWTTVVAFGRYEEITDEPADAELRVRARHILERRGSFWLPATGKLPGSEHHVPVLFRIRIDRVTGRRAARP